MYTITTGGWIAIQDKASLTPFSLDTPKAGSNEIQASMYNNTGGSTLPTTEHAPNQITLQQSQRLITSS